MRSLSWVCLLWFSTAVPSPAQEELDPGGGSGDPSAPGEGQGQAEDPDYAVVGAKARWLRTLGKYPNDDAWGYILNDLSSKELDLLQKQIPWQIPHKYFESARTKAPDPGREEPSAPEEKTAATPGEGRTPGVATRPPDREPSRGQGMPPPSGVGGPGGGEGPGPGSGQGAAAPGMPTVGRADVGRGPAIGRFSGQGGRIKSLGGKADSLFGAPKTPEDMAQPPGGSPAGGSGSSRRRPAPGMPAPRYPADALAAARGRGGAPAAAPPLGRPGNALPSAEPPGAMPDMPSRYGRPAGAVPAPAWRSAGISGAAPAPGGRDAGPPGGVAPGVESTAGGISDLDYKDLADLQRLLREAADSGAVRGGDLLKRLDAGERRGASDRVRAFRDRVRRLLAHAGAGWGDGHRREILALARELGLPPDLALRLAEAFRRGVPARLDADPRIPNYWDRLLAWLRALWLRWRM